MCQTASSLLHNRLRRDKTATYVIGVRFEKENHLAAYLTTTISVIRTRRACIKKVVKHLTSTSPVLCCICLSNVLCKIKKMYMRRKETMISGIKEISHSNGISQRKTLSLSIKSIYLCITPCFFSRGINVEEQYKQRLHFIYYF